MPFNSETWKAIGHQIKQEKERRADAPHRVNLEKAWKEIDRQIAMTPVSRKIKSGDETSWFPNTELPNQASALEVIQADARQMIFPKNRQWFSVNSELSETYLQRLAPEMGRFPFAEDEKHAANILVKAVLDHFHSTYDFRGAIDLAIAEDIKYGTDVLRVRETVIPKHDVDVRAVYSSALRGPAVIPTPIKNTYLDDTPIAVLHEGFSIKPSLIRTSFKKLDDLKRASISGGVDRGWRPRIVARLDPMEDHTNLKGFVELIEYEGDFSLVRSRTNLYLPSVRILVAVGKNDAAVVRFRENQDGSFFTGNYMREHIDSPYGASPLMKGRPIQELATLAANSLAGVAKMTGEPHILWDRYDAELKAQGGVHPSPGGSDGVEDPDKVRLLEIGDPAALGATYGLWDKKYEDVTGVNDPRRGAEVKSHTTAFATDVEQARGQMRTGDYAEAKQTGQLTSVLYQEFAIIKGLKGKFRIPITIPGSEGWVEMSAKDLPDRVALDIHGALGPLNEREELENTINVTNQVLQLIAAGTEMGLQNLPQLDIEKISKHLYQKAGVNDSDRFFTRPSQGLPAGVAGGPQDEAGAQALPGAGAPIPTI